MKSNLLGRLAKVEKGSLPKLKWPPFELFWHSQEQNIAWHKLNNPDYDPVEIYKDIKSLDDMYIDTHPLNGEPTRTVSEQTKAIQAKYNYNETMIRPANDKDW